MWFLKGYIGPSASKTNFEHSPNISWIFLRIQNCKDVKVHLCCSLVDLIHVLPFSVLSSYLIIGNFNPKKSRERHFLLIYEQWKFYGIEFDQKK